MIVVDPVSDQNVRLLLTYLQNFLQRNLADIDLIVLTSLQHEHTSGIELLRRTCHAPIAVLSTAQFLASLPYTRYFKAIDLWLENDKTLPNHSDWRVLASPSQTAESLCLYNALTRELVCGMHVVSVTRSIPLFHRGKDHVQLEATLRTLRQLDIRYLYPGHGRAILARHPLKQAEIENDF